MNVGILSTIGDTPLAKLENIFKDASYEVYAKLEAFNPGGSIKDRPAFNIIRRALDEGRVNASTVIIESSSGNMGVGLAQACAYFGLRFICVVDPKATKQNLEIIKAYGAEIDVVASPDPATGEFLQARIDRVKSLLSQHCESFWPDQYSNLDNPGAHRQTMREIVLSLNGRLDYLFCSTSTCGTIRGCSEYVRENKLQTQIIAVDAMGSVIFGQKPMRRLIPGHGAAVMPKIHRPELVDHCIYVSDLDCVVGCRRLVREEAILAGGSSGGVLSAIQRFSSEIEHGAVCAAIFPDRGERYLDTIYSDTWVEKHLGQVSHLWQNSAGRTHNHDQ
jgi:N-(2-amino-2-carboxyethyl)-L-glutamate synthase